MINQGQRTARQDIKQLEKIKKIITTLHALPVSNEETNRKIDIRQIEECIKDLLIRYGHLLEWTEYCDDCSGCLCHDEHGDCADEEEEDFCDECSLYLSECDCCSDCGYSECSCEDEEKECRVCSSSSSCSCCLSCEEENCVCDEEEEDCP